MNDLFRMTMFFIFSRWCLNDSHQLNNDGIDLVFLMRLHNLPWLGSTWSPYYDCTTHQGWDWLGLSSAIAQLTLPEIDMISLGPKTPNHQGWDWLVLPNTFAQLILAKINMVFLVRLHNSHWQGLTQYPQGNRPKLFKGFDLISLVK